MPSIQISCSTPDSQIYYTLDNSEPDSSKILYTSSFEVTNTVSIKAIGIKEGYLDSNISTFEITEEMLGLPSPRITFVNEKEPYIKLDNYQNYSDISQVKLWLYGPKDNKDEYFINYIPMFNVKENNGVILERRNYENLERVLHASNYGGAAPYMDISIVDEGKESTIYFLNLLENKYKLLDPVIETIPTSGVTMVKAYNYNWVVPEVKVEHNITTFNESYIGYSYDYPTIYQVVAGESTDEGVNFTFYKEGFLDSNTVNSGPFKVND